MRTHSHGSAWIALSRLGAAAGMFVLLGTVVSFGGSCGKSGSTDAGFSGPVGGPVPGAVDSHCNDPDAGLIVQPTSTSSCHPTNVDAGTDTGCGYGTTMFNDEGDDDDCKYHVTWDSTEIRKNEPVYFTVSAVHRTDFSPLTGANTITEVFVQSDPNNPCGSTHPAPNSNPTTTETFPGTYLIGPILFDTSSNQWVVRFHFHEECADLLPDSPHGHAAFYINVP
jgi:hypothetical protein